MSDFNIFQQIKRSFFAFRNGIVADALKKSGSPYRMIFGLNLPQLNEIAQSIGKNGEIAKELHDDINTRESQMLSSMIMPDDQIKQSDEALEWLRGLRSKEAIDIACHKLIRNLPQPLEIAEMCIYQQDSLIRYSGIRLLWNIYPQYPNETRKLAVNAKQIDTVNESLLNSLIEEIDFMTDRDINGEFPDPF